MSEDLKLKSDGEAKPKRKLSRIKNISKGEGGSWLYGIILMVTGVFIIVLGVLDLFQMNFIANFLISEGWSDWATMLPTVGVLNFVVGLFAVIAGYGLIIDQEWGWGIAMFILAYTAVQAIVYIINSAGELMISPSSLNAIGVLVVSIATTAVAVIGLFYLGNSKERYE